MRVVGLYRSNSESERPVLDFARDYERRTGRQLDMLDLNTRDGADMARLYDIMQYPAIVALADDGSLQQFWQGEPLPLMNEVLYYSPALNT